MKKYIIRITALFSLLGFMACNDYVDVIPDNVATLDNAFTLRSQAEKALFTCYSYMPSHGNLGQNPAFFGGDEYWLPSTDGNNAWKIAKGDQRVVDPYINYWQGLQSSKDLYEGIRQCNILIENVHDVPDMTQEEKDKWTAEAKFLKAYYHFWMVRMYGPIVVVKDNLPVEASEDEVRRPQSPVDSVFSYIVQLLDEAAPDLPQQINNETAELGRITRLIDLSVKAQVLVTAASPQFNGNNDFSGFVNSEGEELFNTTNDPTKWERAAQAAKEAVELAETNGHSLYTYQPRLSQYDLSDTTLTQLSIRNAVTEKWNSEIIWGNTNSVFASDQRRATPRGVDPTKIDNATILGDMAPPLKIAEMFYTDKGLPMEDDNTFNYSGRFDLKTATSADRYNIKEGYTVAEMHFNRENRFYADLGFDGGIWYGFGVTDDDSPDLLYVQAKKGQPASRLTVQYSTTGYWPKKLVQFESSFTDGQSNSFRSYPWPVIRLSDLYLLYAEAENEVNGPNPETYHYLNLVRGRAGIPDVEVSWSQYSNNPSKYQSQDGLREIIHRERLIELAFEGKRFWDLRRWKEAASELNKPISGWDLEQATPEGYYRERLIFNQEFGAKDYFWPVPEAVRLTNYKLEQNPYWK